MSWAGIITFFPARESLVSDIPAGDGKIDNLFLQCRIDSSFIFQVTGVIVLTLYLQGLPKTWILNLDSTVSCVIELK